MPAATAKRADPKPAAAVKAGKTVFIVGTLGRDIPGDGHLPKFVEVLIPGLNEMPARRIAVPFESIALP